MTTIGEFINKNTTIFKKASSLEYLVFGTFPKDFLDKPINVSVSQKKGGLILSINGKFVIIINNVFKNSGGGKSRKQKGKGKAKKSRKYQRGGNMSDTIAVIFLSIIMYVFIQNLGMKEEFRQPEYHWEIQSANISDLYGNVLPTINLHNTTLDIKTLNKSLTRALTSNNTRQITKFPRNLTLHPLSYAEFNISRLPAHTEIINMFKNISFPSNLRVNSQKIYEIFGNWKISNTGLVNIQLFDSEATKPEYFMRVPNRQDVEERILNFVTETIQIQKKIGMIRKLENKGQFRLGFIVLAGGLGEVFADGPGEVHYDSLSIFERSIPFSQSSTGIQKLYSKRDQLRGGIVSLIYPDNTSKLSQPSIVVDEDGNPIPDTKDSSRKSRKTKYIKGKSSPEQVQMHDQSQSVLHEALPRVKSERLLNLHIMPVINDEFPLRKDLIREHAKKGGRKKKKSRRKKRTRKKIKK